jgi:hypothetical protein
MLRISAWPRMKIAAEAADLRPPIGRSRFLQEPVVTLDPVGAIALGPMQPTGHSRGQGGRVTGGFVGDHPTRRRPAGIDGPLEEPVLVETARRLQT